MKRIYFMIVALLTLVGGVNAKTVETTLWEDTYVSGVELNAETVATFKEGDVLRVYVTVPAGGANFKIVYKSSVDGWAEHIIPSIGEWPWVNGGETYKDFALTAVDITALSGQNIYIYKGDNSTITKVSLISAVSPTSTTSVWSGDTPHDLDNWNGLQLTSSTYTDILSGAKKGDVLKVTYTSDESGKINICNSGYSSFTGGENSVSTTAEAATVEFEITTATILESIQTGGIVINGVNAMLSAVDLLTYADSYDCVPATIGSDGIATFSSTKNLDFSGTGVTPYYVSAIATGTVTLTAATNATTWEYCGYILKGPEGTYDVPVAASATYPAATYLKGQTSEGTVKASESEDTKFRYIYAKDKNDNTKIGFFKLVADHTLAAHRAYLETETDITPDHNARLVLKFEDDPTAIDEVKSAAQPVKADNVYYNLNGQRVEKAKKGLYIQNGKKVVIK